jgi:ATP/maltotriose-dependent transcriptional regulator MalT
MSTHTVRFEIADDTEARRVGAILEALGYETERAISGELLAPLTWQLDTFATRYKLTPRERDIVCLFVDGKSNAEIGVALEISSATVKWHMTNVLAKAKVEGGKLPLMRKIVGVSA